MIGNTLAIVLARGGSKRIPRKNIKNFLGRPIITYSIDAAIKSGCFDENEEKKSEREYERFSMRGLEVEKLMKVSPRVKHMEN